MSKDSSEVWSEALQIVESEPEYPDAEKYRLEAKEDLARHGVSHADLVFDMLLFFSRKAIAETKRCIAERARPLLPSVNTDRQEILP